MSLFEFMAGFSFGHALYCIGAEALEVFRFRKEMAALRRSSALREAELRYFKKELEVLK